MTGNTETQRAPSPATERAGRALTFALVWLAVLLLWWAFRFALGFPGAAAAFQAGWNENMASGLMPLVRWHIIGSTLAFAICMLAMTSIAEFIRRSQRFPHLAIALNALVVTALAFDASASSSLAALTQAELAQTGLTGTDLRPARKLILMLLGGAIACAWIAYFSVSKQVKAVFVR